MKRFVNDETGFLAWKQQHPNGFVVNSEPVPKADYIVLHRTSCGKLKTPPTPGGGWTTTYIKTCGEDRQALEEAIKRETTEYPSACKLCHPRSARL